MLGPAEVLLTAHHADDQLETVLLNLVRGAGVRGLAAMPVLQRFGRGLHARPLLDLDREALHAWARAQSLAWIEDASNANERFDRNYLRQTVVPLLRARWPSIAHAAARSARHLGEAAKLLDAVAEEDLRTVAADQCLDLSKLESLTSIRRRNVLRSWLRHHGARAPSTRKLASIEHDILHAAYDRTPAIECDGLTIRRHRARLYCTPPLPAVPAESLTWSPEIPLELPGLGRLIATRHERGDRTWIVRFREGGETLARNAHHQRLKKLLQELDVLPWWRGLLPLIYENDELLAVGDLWSRADARVAIQWENRPGLLARSERADALPGAR
jgi:tRNA(Ile)-lysidine synthase